MIWAASTEIFLKQHAVHKTLDSFEKAMRENHKDDRAVDDLRLRRVEVGISLCQWRAESDR
jgi:hypothetical protein